MRQTLKECQVFTALADVELGKIASLAVEKEYEAGTTIFQEGDSANELFVLQEGKVAVQMALPVASVQTSRRVTVYFVTENEVLGWSAIVGPHVYTLAAVCLQRTMVLAVSGLKLRALLQCDHHIGYEVLQGLIKVIGSRLHDTMQVLASERLVTPRAE